MKTVLFALVAVVLVVGSFVGVSYATTSSNAAAPLPTCVKPTGNPTHAQQTAYEACRFDRLEGMIASPTTTVTVPGPTSTVTVPGPTQTVTVTATTTATATNTPTPTVTPTPTETPQPGACATTTPNVPDGPDGRGGCFPGTSNTGPNAAASTMSTYTGSCTITVANTVIDSKVVNCGTLEVRAGGFVLKNSYLNGGLVQVVDAGRGFTVQDALIDSAVSYPACSDGSCPAGKYACGDTHNQTTDCGVNGSSFTILRTEVTHTNRSAYCNAPGPCTVTDSYFHGTNLWPDASNLAHASALREEQNLTARHNSLACDYKGPFVNDDIGCSADLTGYPDFAPIKNNTIDGNLFVANAGNVGSSEEGASFCMYGGASAGKPFSGDPTNATNQKFTNNVFQRGWNRKCAAYGPGVDFAANRTGNVWSGNVWDSGETVTAAEVAP